MTAERTASDAAGLSPAEQQQRAASLDGLERVAFWRETLEQASHRAPKADVDKGWDAILRSVIEEQSAALQGILQGPAGPSEPAQDNSRTSQNLQIFEARMGLLRSCEGWIRDLPDPERSEPLHACLALQLALVVGRLHQWLVIEEVQGGERAEWFWRGWQVLQWRCRHTEALPAWWEPVQEQLARYGALEWRRITQDRDPASPSGQEAISRTLVLLEALSCLHEPTPEWIHQAQRETLQRGLAHDKHGPTDLQTQWQDLRHTDFSELLPDPLRQKIEAQIICTQTNLLDPSENASEPALTAASPPDTTATKPQQKPGATQNDEAADRAMASGQRQAAMLSLGETLLLAGLQEQALGVLAKGLPGWIPAEQRISQARLLASQMLVRAGLWKEAEALHGQAVRAIDPQGLSPDLLAAELEILRTESELLSHELSLALSQKSLTAAAMPTGGGREQWRSLSRSQLGQDLWVLEQLNWKQGGYFVEFGATDGVLLSNSWLLEKQFGWQGICAEPNPKLFERLQQNRSCRVSQACVYRTTGERMRFVLADAYGGLEGLGQDDQHVDKRNAYAAVGDLIEVTTTSLNDLLAQQEAPAVIDYLSIDTEGSELLILEGIDWSRYQFRCITVEHNFTEQRQGIEALLKAQGYQRTEAQWDDWYWKEIH